MQRTSIRRVLGRVAVGAIVVSAAVVPLGGGTAEAATGWSVNTDTPAGLIPLGGGGFSVTVPFNICSVDWTVVGGHGGVGSGSAAGEAGGELRVTSQRAAGQTFQLYPGGVGQDWATGGAGGTSGVDAAGRPGTSDGGAGGGGGGGAGSLVRFGGTPYVGAHGGNGGGGTGGVGGSVSPGPTGNTVLAPSGNLVPVATTFDGRTSDAGGSARTGAGLISAVGVPCPATPPGAPYVIRASSGPEDGVILLGFQPAVPTASQVWSAVTGWEVTVDGGVTWVALPTTARPDGTQTATVRGLANGDYRVAVRATSATGPGVASDLRDVRLVGTPTDVAVTEVSVKAGVSSLRVSWTPPEGAVHGGYVAESYDAAQDGEGTPFATCETALDVHSCVLAAEPGRAYRVIVSGGGGRSSAPVTSGVVAAPPVPAQVPASSGALRVPAGGAGALTAGDAVDVSGSGYLPQSTVTLVVYSTPTVLGSLATSADGSFDTNVTLPAGLPEGTHTLVATGVGPDGEAWTLTQTINARTAATGGASTTGDSAATAVPAAGSLAYTGADIAVPAIGGLLALALGVGLTVLGRRGRVAG